MVIKKKKNKKQEKYLTDFEKDQLIEVVNIGAGNASTALSQMVNKTVIIRVPELFVDKIEKVPKFLGKQEEIMTGVLLKILGDAPGMMFLMFPTDSAGQLARLLTGRKKETHILDTLSRSALQEAGNILAGTSMNALSRFLDMNIIQSVPETATDMLGSVINSVLAEIGKSSDIVLILKVDFRVEGEKISGKLFFIFDPRSTSKILETAKKKISK